MADSTLPVMPPPAEWPEGMMQFVMIMYVRGAIPPYLRGSPREGAAFLLGALCRGATMEGRIIPYSASADKQWPYVLRAFERWQEAGKPWKDQNMTIADFGSDK